MKFSSLVVSLALASSASAFVPVGRVVSTNANTRMSVSQMEPTTTTESFQGIAASVTTTVVSESINDNISVFFTPPTETMNVEVAMESVTTKQPGDAISAIIPGRYNDKEESIALPFLKRSTKLDGSHAGDYGFDPLGFTESYDLYTMQESELRHARLAMLAVVGWPLSEMVAPSWMLQENGCAPSILNGFNPLSFIATVLAFSAFGAFEYQTSLRSTWDTKMGQTHRQDMANIWELGVAGDYNFDPLNLYSTMIGDSAVARKGLREVEISHGRMAMLGIAGFAVQEAITGHPVVENSMFFHPNLLLPALVAGYTAFRMIYTVEHNDRYVFQVSTSSEGQAILENLKLQLHQPDPTSSEEAYGKINEAIEAVKKIMGDAADATGVEKLSLPEVPKLEASKLALPESPKSLASAFDGLKKVYQDKCL